MLSSCQLQAVARRTQTRFPAAIVLLSGGDAGVPHRLRTAQTAAENDGQHRRIVHPDTGIIRHAGIKQRTDLRRWQGPAARQQAAAQVTHQQFSNHGYEKELKKITVKV